MTARLALQPPAPPVRLAGPGAAAAAARQIRFPSYSRPPAWAVPNSPSFRACRSFRGTNSRNERQERTSGANTSGPTTHRQPARTPMARWTCTNPCGQTGGRS